MLPDVSIVGVFVGAIWLAQTIVSAIFAARSIRGDAAWQWRQKMERPHLDALDWIYDAQMWAATRGIRDQLPPLPDSLKGYQPLGDDSVKEWKRLRRRRDRTS